MGYRSRASLAGKVVLAIDRALTWGMDPDARESMLAEQAADWEAMSRDVGRTGRWRMITRQLRGIPPAIWWRLTRREITGIPAAAGMTVLVVAIMFEMAIPGYPPDHRLNLSLVAAGLAIAVWRLIRRPRRIVAAEWRVAALLVGSGAIGSMLTFPSHDGWSSYDPVEMGAPIDDSIVWVGIAVFAVGCYSLVAASLVVRHRRRMVLAAGLLVIVGALIVATTEVVWGVWAAQIDLYATATWLVSALGTVVGAHMLYRLRNLEIV